MKTSPLTIALLVACLVLRISVSAKEDGPLPADIEAEAKRLAQRGKLPEAEEKLRAALRQSEADFGADDPACGYFHFSLATVLAKQGRKEEAVGSCESAAAIFDPSLPLGAENIHSMAARSLGARWAMEIGQAERAAKLLRALYPAFCDCIRSGRARRAGWNERGFPARDLLQALPSPDETGIAELTALFGRALAESGNGDEALPILDEAAESLARTHGPDDPELVRVREAIEKIGRAREEAGERYFVGTLGHISDITFLGNGKIAVDELRRGLRRDVLWILASHPSERFEHYLRTLEERMLAGYRNNGFPESEVRAEYRSEADREWIEVRIVEGPRYLRDQIRITTVPGVDADRLREALLSPPEKNPDSLMVKRIRRALARFADALPKPDTIPLSDTMERLNEEIPGAQFGSPDALDAVLDPSGSPGVLAGGSGSPGWEPGKPLSFRPDRPLPEIESVRRCLADQDHPMARFECSYALEADGTGNLVVDITDPGPTPVVGRVTVDGAKQNSVDDIRALTGLEPGKPATPALVDEAMLALWNSGRFDAFDIDRLPRPNSPEIDFHVRVLESIYAPPLSEPPSADQEIVLRAVDWLNRGMDGEDLVLEWKSPEQWQVTVALSIRSGLSVDILDPANAWSASAVISNAGADAVIRSEGRSTPAHFEFPIGSFSPFLHVLHHKDHSIYFAALGAPYSTQIDPDADAPAIDILVSPRIFFHPGVRIRKEDERLVVDLGETENAFEVDARTGRPLSVAGGRLQVARDRVSTARASIRAEAATGGSLGFTTGWMDVAYDLAPLVERGGVIGAAELREAIDSHRGDAAMLDLLFSSDALAPLAAWAKQFNNSSGSIDNFPIPVSAVELQQFGNLSSFAGYAYLMLAEELLPEAEWLQSFNRELFYKFAGKSQYNAEVMDSLLGDPSVGPVGSLYCAQLLAKHDPETAGKFLDKAERQSTAEGFLQDWQALNGSESPIGRSLGQALEALAAIDSESEKIATRHLSKPEGMWLRGFLGRLRSRPSGKDWATWISGSVSQLWDMKLREAFLARVQALRPPPPLELREVVATVEGQPVAAAFVQGIEQQNRGALRVLGLPEPDPDIPWSQQPALACAVRATLARIHLRTKGEIPDAAQIGAFIDSGFPDLVDKPDDQWIGATGQTRGEMLDALSTEVAATAMVQGLAKDIPEDPGEAVLRDYYEEHRARYGVRVDADVLFHVPNGGSPLDVAAGYRHVAELIPELLAGKDVEDPPQTRVFQRRDVDATWFDLAAVTAIEGLEPGGASESMPAPNGIMSFVLRDRREADPPPFAEVKDGILQHWRQDQLNAAIRKWFEERERTADVRLPDGKMPGGSELVRRLDSLAPGSPAPGASPPAPSIAPFANLALDSLNEGNFAQAAKAFRRAIELAREYPDPQNNLGLLFYYLGSALMNLDDYRGAAEAYQEAVDWFHEHPADGFPLVHSLLNLGRAFNKAGLHDEAESAYRKVLKRLTTVPESPWQAEAEALLGLGTAARNLGRPKEAEDFLGKAVDLGRQHGHVIVTRIALEELSNLVFERGHYTEAEAMAREALAALQSASEPSPSMIGSSLRWLANILSERGMLKEAEEPAREALALAQAQGSPEDYDNLWSRIILANILTNRGVDHYEEAEALVGEALRLGREHHGDNHARSVSLAELSVGLLLHRNRFEEAEKQAREQLAAAEATPYEPRLLARSISLLAQVLKEKGRLVEADSLFTRAIEQLDSSGSATDESRLDLRHLRIGSLALLERYEDAERESLSVIADAEKSWGPDHPSTAGFRVTLAGIRQSRGQPEDSLELVRQARTAAALELSDDHPIILYANLVEAKSLRDLGRFDEADDKFEELLRRMLERWGEDHTDTARVRHELAESLQRQSRFDDALPLAEKNISLRERILPPDHPKLADSFELLSSIHSGLGHSARSEEFAAKAKAIRSPEPPEDAR